MPQSGRAHREEIQRRRAQLPPDLLNDPTFAEHSPYWDTWFRDEQDARRRTAFTEVQPRPRHGRRCGPGPLPPVSAWVEEEEEEDLDLKQALEDSLRTHAAEEARMCPGLDIVLRRSVEEVQHPPPPPPWYERMAMELPPVPPVPEGLISVKWS